MTALKTSEHARKRINIPLRDGEQLYAAVIGVPTKNRAIKDHLRPWKSLTHITVRRVARAGTNPRRSQCLKAQ
jgi:hypothetical protein